MTNLNPKVRYRSRNRKRSFKHNKMQHTKVRKYTQKETLIYIIMTLSLTSLLWFIALSVEEVFYG